MLAELRLLVQVALGIVFLFSTAGKLRDPKAFVEGVAHYRVLSTWVAYFLGSLFIPLEAWLAVAHLTGWMAPVAVPLGLVMLVLFAVAVFVNLRHGRVLPCYCFGRGGEMISGRTLARLFLLSSSELLLLFNRRALASNPFLYSWQVSGFMQVGLTLFWSTFLLFVGLWLLNLKDLLAMVRPYRRCQEPIEQEGSTLS